MALKKYKLTKAGEDAVKLGRNILTKHDNTDHRIVMKSITDKQAEILLAKGHPFIEQPHKK